MIRIIEISPNPHDATSFYRCRGPLTRLQKTGEIEVISLDVNDYNHLTWAELSIGDILFMQRPASESALKLIELAIRMNMPVWVDYDDLLLEVPKWNRSKTYYDQPEVQNSMQKILAMATVITVSTGALREILLQYNENVIMIQNAIDTQMLPEPNNFTDNNIVVWRGGDTHVNDLYVHSEGINKMMKQFADYQFIFIGYDAPFLKDYGNKSVIPNSDIFSYFKLLKSLNPSYNITPLVNNMFNRCKSNIGWLETHYYGALSLWPEFNLLLDSEEVAMTFGEGVPLNDYFKELINLSLDDKHVMWEKGMSNILDFYTLEVANSRRLNLIKDLAAQFL